MTIRTVYVYCVYCIVGKRGVSGADGGLLVFYRYEHSYVLITGRLGRDRNETHNILCTCEITRTVAQYQRPACLSGDSTHCLFSSICPDLLIALEGDKMIGRV